jgi:hypothetical protein
LDEAVDHQILEDVFSTIIDQNGSITGSIKCDELLLLYYANHREYIRLLLRIQSLYNRILSDFGHFLLLVPLTKGFIVDETHLIIYHVAERRLVANVAVVQTSGEGYGLLVQSDLFVVVLDPTSL